MLIQLSKKPSKIHSNLVNKQRPINTLSALSEKSIQTHQVKKHKPFETNNLLLNEVPLLNFTSFQHYLEESNQSQYNKQQNDRIHRSQQKCKTQQYFAYNRQKHTSSSKRNTKFLSIEESHNFDTQISPFQPDKQIVLPHKFGKSKRNVHSKSQSSNYHESESFASSLLNEKLGTIEGWNLQHQTKNQAGLATKNILKDKLINNNHSRALKTSQNSMRKEQSSTVSMNRTPVRENNPFRKSSTKKSSNKENVSQSLPTFESRDKNFLSSKQNLLFHPMQPRKICFKTQNPLTEINELEEEILMSRREEITRRILNEPLREKNQKQNSNINMLKKQAEYLCTGDEDNETFNDGKQNAPDKSISMSLNFSDVPYNNSKPFKPFKKFPNHSKKQSSNLIVDSDKTPQKASNPHQPSHRMLKILQSINQNNENLLTEPRTPKNIGRNRKLNTKTIEISNDLKSASKQKQKFNLSIKDKKSHSEFQSVSRNGIQNRNKTPKLNNDIVNCGQESVLMAIVNSFHHPRGTPKDMNKFIRSQNKNYSLMKSIDNEKDQQKFHKRQKCYTEISLSYDQEGYGIASASKQISEFEVNPYLSEYSFQQAVPISFNDNEQMQEKNLILDESQEPLQRLKQLSQQMKKMGKLSTPVALSAKYNKLYKNKKFTQLSKTNKKEKNQAMAGIKQVQKNMQDLSIGKVQGRKLQQIKKWTEIQ